jgi:CRISPR-associated protein Csy1
MAPDPSTTARRQAEEDLARGDAERALERLAGLDLATDEEADFLAARAEAALGRLDAARARLVTLRSRLVVPSVMLELHLADVENRRGDRDAAITALRAAILVNPELAIAHSNLASLLVAAGRIPEARDALVRATALAPGDAALQLWLARLHASLGDGEHALESAAAAESAGPASVEEWREIGLLRAEYWKWPEADRALAEASRRDPGNAETETLRAVVRQELGDAPGALAALALATARHPADLGAALSARLMLPQVYADGADLAAWRARYEDGLARTIAEAGRWRPRDALRLTRTNFLLAYQGRDDRALQRDYSALLARLAAAAHPAWREPRARTFAGGRRLRVGYVGAIFRDCTAGRYFERWITGLDPRRFERFVYHTAPLTDEFTVRIAASAEHFTTLRTGAEEIAARLAADELDVIVHPEVGMTPHSYVLAALRLAPVQLAGWGHPVTTGSDAIDGYLTCAMMEPDDAASHYVEPLVALPGLGVDYALPPAPQPTERTALGLPAEGRAYLCAQSLFKVHPDMDALLAAILEADPGSVLVFFQATARAVTEQFARRLQGVLAARGIPARGQLKFLPRMNGAGFRRALAAVDVVLDTVHWSGGNTSLDAFAAGTPVVAFPGRFMRGRQSAAMLQAMGLGELVAHDADDYVRIAVEAARDRERNAALRASIARERGALFDRPEPIAALQSTLLQLAAKS